MLSSDEGLALVNDPNVLALAAEDWSFKEPEDETVCGGPEVEPQEGGWDDFADFDCRWQKCGMGNGSLILSLQRAGGGMMIGRNINQVKGRDGNWVRCDWN